jgi:flagellar protein FliS
MSKRLEQLYIYIIDEYTAANINNSVKSLDNVLKILLSLRETWAEAIEVWRKERVANGVCEQRMSVQAAGY